MRLALALWLIALPARAEPSYWTRAREPELVRALRLVREGQAQLSPALALGLPSTPGTLELTAARAIAAAGARARYALAKQLAPSLREARLAYAELLAQGKDDASRRGAIDELHALRDLDPLYEVEHVAFLLGILHARGRELDAARTEYERALTLQCDEGRQPTVLLDLAELVMWQGDLPRALALYERAAREADSGSRVLALWGGAVVLDRMGDRSAAKAMARRAISSDHAPFAALQSTSVFLVSSYEREYYEALGHLALAELEPSQEDPRALLEDVQKYRPKHHEAHALRALRGFDRYLIADGGEGPFAEDAREHIRELTRP